MSFFNRWESFVNRERIKWEGQKDTWREEGESINKGRKKGLSCLMHAWDIKEAVRRRNWVGRVRDGQVLLWLECHLRSHTPTEGRRWVAFGPVPISGWWEAAG